MIDREHAKAEPQHASGASSPGRIFIDFGPCRKVAVKKCGGPCLKNRCFIDLGVVSCGVQKLIKIEPWGAKGPPSAPRLVAGVVTFGIAGRGAPRVRNYKTTKSQASGALSDTPMADGQANFLRTNK